MCIRDSPRLADGAAGLFGRVRPEAKDTVSGTDRSRAPRTTDQARADRATPDVYHSYYATRLLHEYGGDLWLEWQRGPRRPGPPPLESSPWSGGMADWLSVTQSRVGNNFGSWNPDAGPIGTAYGRLGTTAMAVLILETPYRYPRATAR